MKTWSPLYFFTGLVVYLSLGPAVRAPFAASVDHHALHCTAPEGNPRGFYQFLPTAVSSIFIATDRSVQLNYVLRCIEGLGWLGVSSLNWHLSRILYASIAAGFLAWGLHAILPLWLACLCALVFFAGPQNVIWMNVGYLETYGAFFSILGVSLWLRGARRTGFFFLAVAGLMKESFIPVLPAAALLFGDRKLVVPAFVVFAFELGLALLFPKYSTPISFSGFHWRIATLVRRLAPQVIWGLPLGAVAVFSRKVNWTPLALAFLLLVVPQALEFQGGDGFSGLIPANAFVVFSFAWSFLHLPPHPRAAVAVVSAGFLLLSAHRTQSQAREIVRRNSIHQAKVDAVVAALKANPDARLVFATGEPWDMEHLVSVRRLVSVGLDRGIRPELRFEPRRELSSVERTLEASLRKHSEFKTFQGESGQAIVVRFRKAPESTAPLVVNIVE